MKKVLLLLTAILCIGCIKIETFGLDKAQNINVTGLNCQITMVDGTINSVELGLSDIVLTDDTSAKVDEVKNLQLKKNVPTLKAERKIKPECPATNVYFNTYNYLLDVTCNDLPLTTVSFDLEQPYLNDEKVEAYIYAKLFSVRLIDPLPNKIFVEEYSTYILEMNFEIFVNKVCCGIYKVSKSIELKNVPITFNATVSDWTNVNVGIGL